MRTWESNIKIDKERCEGVNWIHVAQGSDQ
jgi:hypothetical protein